VGTSLGNSPSSKNVVSTMNKPGPRCACNARQFHWLAIFTFAQQAPIRNRMRPNTPTATFRASRLTPDAKGNLSQRADAEAISAWPPDKDIENEKAASGINTYVERDEEHKTRRQRDK